MVRAEEFREADLPLQVGVVHCLEDGGCGSRLRLTGQRRPIRGGPDPPDDGKLAFAVLTGRR